MKIGVLGNTKLTLKGLTLLKSLGHQIQYVFGIPNEQLSHKTFRRILSSIQKVYS